MDSRRIPYYPADPENRWTVSQCPECGQRKYMRVSDERCGACEAGEKPRLQQASKPALDVLVDTAKAQFGQAELEYLADRFAEAAREISGKSEVS